MRSGAADTVERWLSPLLLSIFVLNAAVLWQLSYGGAPPFWAIPASLIMAVLAAFVVTHLTCKHMPLECLFEVESPVTTKTMWLMVLFIRRRGLAHDTTLPPLKAGLKKCVVQQRDVVDYRRVCQLESPMAHDVLPLLYLDALATSLKLFLAVHPAMPASLLGAIHRGGECGVSTACEPAFCAPGRVTDNCILSSHIPKARSHELWPLGAIPRLH